MRSMAKQQYFPVGSLVEVRTDEEDFKGIYFLATIKERSKKKKKMCYVEYHDLLAREEQDSERLIEHVDISCLRPTPPPQEHCNFEPNDVVDAFYKDGWWIGVVNRVVERGERTFVMTFQDPPDELEFGLDQLRIHWDWVDGRWTRPLNKSVAAMMYEGGREGEVSLDEEDCRDAWFPAILHEELRNGAEYSKANADNKAQRLKVTADSFHVRPSPPQFKEKEFVLFEKVDAFFDFGWWSGIITKLLDGSRYVVFVKQMKRDKEFHQSDLRSYLEWKDENWFISSQDNKLSETGEFNGERKRGRPRKLPNESLSTPIRGDWRRIDSEPRTTPEVGVTGAYDSLSSKEKMGFDELQGKQACSWADGKTQRGSTPKRTLANMQDGKVFEESVRLQKRRSSGTEIRRNTDSLDTSQRKSLEANCIRDIGGAETEAPCCEFDNVPLSKWTEGMHPPSIIDGSKISPVKSMEERTENKQRLEKDNEKFLETRKQTSGPVDMGSVDPSDQQYLPFVKKCTLWETFDSMEVFQRIPQRPHFRPLEQCKESLREGLAIGYMVNFSGLVEKVSALQFNCAKSTTDDVLETLADLERHGFEVSLVREQVARLLAMKDKQEKLVGNVNEINNQILVHNRKMSRIEDEIIDINQQIQKLQEKLLLAESRKEKEDSEVATLQAKLLEIEESIKNVEQVFEGIGLLRGDNSKNNKTHLDLHP